VTAPPSNKPVNDGPAAGDRSVWPAGDAVHVRERKVPAVLQVGGRSLHDRNRPSLTRYGLYPILVDAMPTVFDGDFEWDSAKAASNLVKHGVSFPEAATVFADPYAVYLDDGSGIGRLVVIGASLRERLLYVVHVERGERDRIISARPATSGEREVYETGGHS
jgi:uncharacterized protein